MKKSDSSDSDIEDTPLDTNWQAPEPEGRSMRQDNSLSLLTQKFLEVLQASPNKSIELPEVIKVSPRQVLRVQKRRIYDITNVL